MDAAMQREPRFFYARSSKERPVRLDAKRTPVLSHRITLDLHDVTLETALAAITREVGLRLAYSKAKVPLDKTVSIKAENITVAGAIGEVLFDVDVDVIFTASAQAMLVPRVATAVIEATGAVTGRVTDLTSSEAVPRAQITIIGTTLGHATDDSGRYRIVGVPAGQRQVSVRRVGYAPQTRTVAVSDGATSTVDFALARTPTMLSDVVSTATGQQERYKVGNVIASVTADSVMRAAPVTNVNDFLSGRVPGLQIYNAGGYTGATSLIRIRGTNSFTVSNDPIIIIDGVRVEGSPGQNPRLGAATNGLLSQFRPGRLADISTYEIESIDVVKGPSAATLYGSDAANGVIVIRTKQGAPGRPRWRAWSEQGTSRPADHFLPGYWAYGTNRTTGATQQCALTQVAAGVCRQDSVVTWNPLEDAATSPMATGHRQVYGTQVNGGVQTFTYFLSGEWTDETGFLRMPKAEQARIKQLRGVTSQPAEVVRPNYVNLGPLRTNVGTSIGQKAHVQLASGLVFNTTAIPGAAIYTSGAFHLAPPTANGGWFSTRPGEQFEVTSSEATTRFTGSLAGDYQPNAWLSTRATIGLDASGSNENALQKYGEGPPQTATGQRQSNEYDIKVWSVDLSATASHDLRSNLRSRTTVGAQYNRRREYDLFGYGTNLAPGSETLAGAATRTLEEATTETIVAGAFVEQSVAFSERLFLNAAVRLDGGSAFGASFKTIAYPKASISWLATDGGRSGWPKWIDNLRLRAAWGSSGVQPGAVASLQRDCLAPAFVNGASVSGATLCPLGTSKLKPVMQTEYEAGVDGERLRSRLKVELTLYHRQSHDAISSIPVAPSANTISVVGTTQGNLTIPVNLGSVRNRGIEGSISGRALDWRQATVDLGLSANLNENRLISLGAGVPFTPTSANQPGYPLNSRFQRRYTWSDGDQNGIITNNEVTLAPTPSYMGPVHPQHVVTGTATLGLFRETLRLSAMGDYRSGSIITDFTTINNCIFLTCRAAADPKAPLAEQAAARAQALGSSAGFVYSGRFLSLREVTATYLVPPRVAGRVRARGAQISVSGRNVHTFLKKCACYSVESTQAIPNDNLGPQNPGAPMPRYLIARLTLEY